MVLNRDRRAHLGIRVQAGVLAAGYGDGPELSRGGAVFVHVTPRCQPVLDRRAATTVSMISFATHRVASGTAARSRRNATVAAV